MVEAVRAEAAEIVARLGLATVLSACASLLGSWNDAKDVEPMPDEVLAVEAVDKPGGEPGDEPGKEPPEDKIVVNPPLSSFFPVETKFGDAILTDGASSIVTSTEVSEVRMRS